MGVTELASKCEEYLPGTKDYDKCMKGRLLDDTADDTTTEPKAAGSEYDTYDGSCEKAIPIVSESDAIAVLICQILVPGVGAMIAAYRSVDGFNYPSCGHGIG